MLSPTARKSTSAIGLLAAACLLTACGEPTPASPPPANSQDDPAPPSTELEDAGGAPCPDQLPIGEDPGGYGFGVDHLATEQPNLSEPEEAWVCAYDLVDEFDSDEVDAATWIRRGDAEPVASEDLPALRDALDGLTPADPGQNCTADLGPRWLISYTHQGDLTGVVVEGFGCRNVLLTDNPHITPPGEKGQPDIVDGILDGGGAVLEALGLGRPR